MLICIEFENLLAAVKSRSKILIYIRAVFLSILVLALRRHSAIANKICLIKANFSHILAANRPSGKARKI